MGFGLLNFLQSCRYWTLFNACLSYCSRPFLQLLFCLQPTNHGEKPPFKGEIADRIYGKCGIICNTLHELAACLSPHVFTLNIVSSPRSIGRSFLYSLVLGSVKCSSNSSSVLVAEKDQTRCCLCYCNSFCLEKTVSVWELNVLNDLLSKTMNVTGYPRTRASSKGNFPSSHIIDGYQKRSYSSNVRH